MKFLVSVLLFQIFFHLSAQAKTLEMSYELTVDGSRYTSSDNILKLSNQDHLCFYYNDENEVAEFKLHFSKKPDEIFILRSADFDLLDTILFIEDAYRFKVRFHELTRSEFLRVSFLIKKDGSEFVKEINLQALYNTRASIYPSTNELFVGEEKLFEVLTNNADNLLLSKEWTRGLNVDYRFSERNGIILLHLIPNLLNTQVVKVPIELRKPYLDQAGLLRFSIDSIHAVFNVKTSRLQFLQFDKKEISLDEISKKEGVVLQLDNNSLLQINKTYRIENQEEPGGPLIAELFTTRRLANDKVLCLLRPYNFHRISEGYLYIKDGDKVRYITNLSITPATKINKISILHEGKDWKQSNQIYPGEVFDIRIEGLGLHKAKFHFEDLEDVTRDTLVRTENMVVYKLKVPIDISKKKLNIFNHSEPTDEILQVAEYHIPRDFDFVYLNYGDLDRKVSGLREPILYEKVVRDLTLNFNTTAIDKDNLHGIQYIDIDVRITGKKNELVEMRTINNIVVCPSNMSPRSEYYPATDCFNGILSLNKFIRRQTYDLDDWSRISLTIKHDKSKYGNEGFTKEVDVILKRRYGFDIEVSFPAGLITASKQENGEIGFGDLSGISMAMIAQFSFYHPEKINVYRPYKIGAGFLAFNAFNFQDNVDSRDVGLVILGSLYPTTRDVKLTFPLYVGGGYFLKDKKFFFLIGPGIRVKL